MTAGPPARADLQSLHSAVERYYTHKLHTHGATPRGVDWPSLPNQELRFVQLLKLCAFDAPFSVNDIGCGYGALLDFLNKRYRGHRIDYLGLDLSLDMVLAARQRTRRRTRVAFEQGSVPSRVADYALASGIFNVRLDQSAELWTAYVRSTLADLARCSRRGLAVNFMLAPAGAHAIPRQLYVCQPQEWEAYCRQILHMRTELVTDYGLPEFTLLARHP